MPSGRFSLSHTNEYGEQCGGQDASLLDAVGDGEVARQKSIVFPLTLPIFIELAEDGEKYRGTAKARQDFTQSITAESIRSFDQVYEGYN